LKPRSQNDEAVPVELSEPYNIALLVS
jgi:hypothetical protein